jgi:toxin-antitoxin system PIN domain toxin
LLLALCFDRHIHHHQANSWLSQQGKGAVSLCRTTQLSLLRLLSYPAIMGSAACSQTQAWSTVDALCSDDRFGFRAEPSSLEVELRKLTSGPTISAKVWPDAYLAAFAISAGLTLVTFDGGFRQYPGLRLKLLT